MDLLTKVILALLLPLLCQAQVKDLGFQIAEVNETLLQQSLLEEENNDRLLLGLPVILKPEETQLLLDNSRLREKLRSSSPLPPPCGNEESDEESHDKEKRIEIKLIGSNSSIGEDVVSGDNFVHHNVRIISVPNLIYRYARFDETKVEELFKKDPSELSKLLHQDIQSNPGRYLGYAGYFLEEGEWIAVALPSEGMIHGHLALEKALNLSVDEGMDQQEKISQIEATFKKAGEVMTFDEQLAVAASINPLYDESKASFDPEASKNLEGVIEILAAEKTGEIAGICGDQHYAKARVLSMLMGDKAKDNVFIYSYASAGQHHLVLGAINPNDPSEVATVNYSTSRSLKEGGVNNLNAPASQDYGTNVRIFTPNNDRWDRMKERAEIVNSLGAFYNTVMGVESTPINEGSGDGQSLGQASYQLNPNRKVSVFRGRTSSGVNVTGLVSLKSKRKQRKFKKGTYSVETQNAMGIGFEERMDIFSGKKTVVPRFFLNSRKDRSFTLPTSSSSSALVGIRRNFSAHAYHVKGQSNPSGDGSLLLAPRVGLKKETNGGKTLLSLEGEVEYAVGIKDGRAATDYKNYHKQIALLRNYTSVKAEAENQFGLGYRGAANVEWVNTQLGNSIIAGARVEKEVGGVKASLEAAKSLVNTNPVFIYDRSVYAQGSLSGKNWTGTVEVSKRESLGPSVSVGAIIKLGK